MALQAAMTTMTTMTKTKSMCSCHQIDKPEIMCKSYTLDGRPCTMWHAFCKGPTPTPPPTPPSEPPVQLNPSSLPLPQRLVKEFEDAENAKNEAPIAPEAPRIATDYCFIHQDPSMRDRCEQIAKVKERMEHILRNCAGIDYNDTHYAVLRTQDDKPYVLVRKNRHWDIRRINYFKFSKSHRHSSEDIVDALVYAPKKMCMDNKCTSFAFVFIKPDRKRFDGTCLRDINRTAIRRSDLLIWDPNGMYNSSKPKLVLTELTLAQYAAIAT